VITYNKQTKEAIEGLLYMIETANNVESPEQAAEILKKIVVFGLDIKYNNLSD
jgi:hypothetical protein